MAAIDVITISSSPPAEASNNCRASLRLPSSPHTSPYFTKPQQYRKGDKQLKSGSRAEKIPEGIHTGFQTAKDLSILDGLSRFAFKGHVEDKQRAHDVILNSPKKNKKASVKSTKTKRKDQEQHEQTPQQTKRPLEPSSDNEKSLQELRECYRRPGSSESSQTKHVDEGSDGLPLLRVANTEALCTPDSPTKRASPDHFARKKQRLNHITDTDSKVCLKQGEVVQKGLSDAPQLPVVQILRSAVIEPITTEAVPCLSNSNEKGLETPGELLEGACPQRWQTTEVIPLQVSKQKAKSSRTVTDIALSAFKNQNASESSHLDRTSTTLLTGESKEFSKKSGANEAQPTATTVPPEDAPKDVQTQKKRRKGTTSNSRKKKKEAASLPKLPAPEVALQTLKTQEWVFGTSSQLTRDDVPGPLRNLEKDVHNVARDEAEMVNNQKLWDAATFTGAQVEYVGSTPLPKPTITDNLPHVIIDQPAVQPAQPVKSSTSANAVKLLVPQYSRPKPTLLCAANIFQSPDVRRTPLVSIPINAQGMHTSAAANARSPAAKSSRGRSRTPTRPEAPTGKPSAENENEEVESTSVTENPAVNIPIKKPRGRPPKNSAAKESAKSTVKKPRGRPPKNSPKKQGSTSRKVKRDEEGFEEIDDSESAPKDEEGFEEIDDSETDAKPSPPRRKLQATTKKRATESPKKQAKKRQKKQEADDPARAAKRLAELRGQLFPKLTNAVKTVSPTLDPRTPNWYEKILLYDPIVLEDITAWFNDGRLSDLERPLELQEVQQWCDDNSVCCIWRNGTWGGLKDRH